MTSTLTPLTPLTDLDYKALFLDTVRMMAEIARAAGFDPNDPGVEPPDVMARVENMRAERDEALQRLADARAPVGGVNVEEVLSDPDRPWLFAPWVDVQARLDVVPVLAREVIRLRLAPDAAQAYAVACEASADAASNDLEVMREKCDELRLTLAAEQGKPEGAPGEGWEPNYHTGQFPYYQWRKTAKNGERVTVDYFPVERRWEWCFLDRPSRGNFPAVRDRHQPTARAAMQTVDKALSGEG